MNSVDFLIVMSFAVISPLVCTAGHITGDVWIVNDVTIDGVVQAYEQSSESSLKAVVGDLSLKLRMDGVRQLRQRASHVKVSVQSLPDLKEIASGTTDADGRFDINFPDSPSPMRVYACKKTLENGKPVYYEGVSSVYLEKNAALLELRKEHVTLKGCCVGRDGRPRVGVMVKVSQYPRSENAVLQRMSEMFACTDENGIWRCDGLVCASLNEAAVVIANTNLLQQQRFDNIPLSVFVGVSSRFVQSSSPEIEVSTITDKLRNASRRIMSAYERKTGKPYPLKAPMVDFSVSTNNVIYVPDLVLSSDS